MKITAVETLVCSGGWRPWMFVKITTDSGPVGYSECSDSFGSNAAIAAAVKELGATLVGTDPRPVERIYWDLYRISRQSAGGPVQKAIAGIENALLDIKAKDLGVPVYALLGGPLRSSLRVYWSHCGSTRVRSAKHIGKAALRTYDDVAALGSEVKKAGYTALKTNLLLLEKEPAVIMQGYRGPPGSAALALDLGVIRQIDALLRAFRAGAGPDVDIMLDLNSHFRADASLRLAEALESHELAWVEIDSLDPVALRDLKDKLSTPIASGENLGGPRGYRPFLEARSQDVVVIDVPWNGLLQSRKIADMAETFDMNVAPHNHYSALATLISAHFCMATANAPILEVDVDDVPWRDQIVTRAPVMRDGYLTVPDGPGWGAEVDEAVVRAHPWP